MIKDVWNALFGEDQLVAIRQADGRLTNEWGERVPNGAWRGRAGARNRIVSAVSVVHQLSSSTLRTRGVTMVHNPWANNPLPADALPIPQIMISVPDGRITRRDGRNHADVLGIPNSWPVADC
jgi:hypothetical protein